MGLCVCCWNEHATVLHEWAWGVHPYHAKAWHHPTKMFNLIFGAVVGQTMLFYKICGRLRAFWIWPALIGLSPPSAQIFAFRFTLHRRQYRKHFLCNHLNAFRAISFRPIERKFRKVKRRAYSVAAFERKNLKNEAIQPWFKWKCYEWTKCLCNENEYMSDLTVRCTKYSKIEIQCKSRLFLPTHLLLFAPLPASRHSFNVHV